MTLFIDSVLCTFRVYPARLGTFVIRYSCNLGEVVGGLLLIAQSSLPTAHLNNDNSVSPANTVIAGCTIRFHSTLYPVESIKSHKFDPVTASFQHP